MANCELRARARQVLGGQIFKSEWLYALVVSLAAGAVISATSAIVIGLLLIGIVEIGHGKYYLERSRGTIKYDQIMVATDGVKGDVGSHVILGLLINVFIALWSLLFVIPGIVKSYSYAMAYYIKIDHPEYTPTQAIDESRRIMNGNKMKLFMLDLSFIGWMIVGSLCFGIGTLWVTAYMRAAHAEFYRDIIGDNTVVFAQEEIAE
jgi:uncharacterized membrane protein